MGGICKKSGKWGCFVKKLKMGGVFLVKKVENGGVFVKKWAFPQRTVHYVQYQYFFILHFPYLGEGWVRTQYTPCLRAWA